MDPSWHFLTLSPPFPPIHVLCDPMAVDGNLAKANSSWWGQLGTNSYNSLIRSLIANVKPLQLIFNMQAIYSFNNIKAIYVVPSCSNLQQQLWPCTPCKQSCSGGIPSSSWAPCNFEHHNYCRSTKHIVLSYPEVVCVHMGCGYSTINQPKCHSRSFK